MWIYDAAPCEPKNTIPAKAVPDFLPQNIQLPTSKDDPCPERSAQKSISSGQNTAPLPARSNRFSSIDCWLLAGAFLMGTAAAGVLCALCDIRQLPWAQYYLQMWRALFAVSDAHPAAVLFVTEYLTLLVAATVLLLLGFSAFGPALIVLAAMLYGTGNGLLVVQLFSGTSPVMHTFFTVLTMLPSAAATASLCLLGCASLRVSGNIRSYALHAAHAPAGVRAGAAMLLRQYLLTLVLLVPLCGTAVGLACLEGRVLQ